MAFGALALINQSYIIALSTHTRNARSPGTVCKRLNCASPGTCTFIMWRKGLTVVLCRAASYSRSRRKTSGDGDATKEGYEYVRRFELFRQGRLVELLGRWRRDLERKQEGDGWTVAESEDDEDD